ncbi:MAG: hypothetical protein MAG431_02162 [Chloroflexi bacterium]|nr:hypothetical protein [Chloroflexota bacterium]
MKDRFNAFLDEVSEYLAHRKGLLPLLGIGLVILNLLIKLIFPNTWLSATELFLHLGVILAIVGFLLGWAL